MIEYENLNKVNYTFLKTFNNDLKIFFKDGRYILSKNVLKFEKNFSSFLNSKFCTGVGNGLDALFISLETLRLPKNSEVIVPANTYYATILAILKAGLKPVLVEPNLDTYNINCDEIKKKLPKKQR